MHIYIHIHTETCRQHYLIALLAAVLPAILFRLFPAISSAYTCTCVYIRVGYVRYVLLWFRPHITYVWLHMCVYIIHIYTYTYACAYTYICIHSHTHTHTYKHMDLNAGSLIGAKSYTCIYTYSIHTYILISKRLTVLSEQYLYICIYTYTYVCIHTLNTYMRNNHQVTVITVIITIQLPLLPLLLLFSYYQLWGRGDLTEIHHICTYVQIYICANTAPKEGKIWMFHHVYVCMYVYIYICTDLPFVPSPRKGRFDRVSSARHVVRSAYLWQVHVCVCMLACIEVSAYVCWYVSRCMCVYVGMYQGVCVCMLVCIKAHCSMYISLASSSVCMYVGIYQGVCVHVCV
jgi:hypothetical protein